MSPPLEGPVRDAEFDARFGLRFDGVDSADSIRCPDGWLPALRDERPK